MNDDIDLRKIKTQERKVLHMIHWSITIALFVALLAALTQLS